MKDKELTWLQLEYSWRWFEFHAEQRLKAFYYFLIIVGFLWYSYASDFIRSENFLKILLCLVGMSISLAFLCLEFRNEHLVNFARDELDKLDTEIETEIRRKDKEDKRKFFITHSFWLKVIYISSLLIFFILFLKDSKIIKIFECIQKSLSS